MLELPTQPGAEISEVMDLQTSPDSQLFRYTPISPLEFALASRLSETRDSSKTVLLQIKSPELLSSFLRAAWHSGWQTAVLNADLPAGSTASVRERLGPCLHVQASEHEQVRISDNSSSQPLSAWLAGVPLKAITPYRWREDEPALILFTSGSTGEPKGVCHSFGNILRSAQLFVDHFALTREDTVFCLAPVHTMSGLRSVVIPFFCDRTITFPAAGTFLNLVIELAGSAASHILCGPVFVRQLSAYGPRVRDYLVRIKAIFCTGADLTETDREQVQKTLHIPVLNYYGLTETCGIVMAEKTTNQMPDRLPPPCSGVDVVTSPLNGHSEAHKLIIRSPNLFLGYLGEQPARRSSLDTGDLVRKTADGQLQLQGRRSGIVKGASTEWLHPLRLEKWLKQHCSLPDCHVSPVQEGSGYRLSIAVAATPPLPTTAIDNRIQLELGPDYVPLSWEYARIERNPLGKVIHIAPLNMD